MEFDAVEGIGIVLFCLLVIAFGPIAKLVAYAGFVYGLYKVYKSITKQFMWFFLVKAIAGAIIGQASNAWFRDTKMGVWFYNKVDSLYNWAAKRYNVKLLTDEEKRMEKFPALKARLEKIEKQLGIK